MTDSKTFPLLRDCKFVCLRLGRITPGKGHVGVEFSVGSDYLPCKNIKDSFQNACQLSGSYYRVHNFNDDGTNDWPHGIFINNVDRDRSDSSRGITHDWARRLVSVSVEIYSRTPGVGYTRFSYPGDRFTHPAHAGLYSDVLGDIELPQAQFYDDRPDASGRYKVARINGFVTDGGRAVDGNAVEWRIFGGKGQTSTGFSIADFRIFANHAGGPGGKGGYYDSGPLHPGNYRCGITHRDSTGKTIKSLVKYFDIDRPFERVDVPLDDVSFWR